MSFSISSKLFLRGGYRLTKYQSSILRYFRSATRSKRSGLLLLYMEVGTGKTLTSLACAADGLKGSFKHAFVLCPKSIIDEFKRNIELLRLIDSSSMESDGDITYVAYNSGNSWQELSKYPLEDSLFIIDEVHLFLRAVIKSRLLPEESKFIGGDVGNAARMFYAIAKLKRKFLICLTGTPAAKHPFELVPLLNKFGCNFPSKYDQFSDKYIDPRGTLTNVSDIKRQLKGLIAYVGHPDDQHLKASPLKIVELEMSTGQYKQYICDYIKELKEKGFTNNYNAFNIMFGSKSSFHTKTFEDCVYWNPYITESDRYAGNKIHFDETHCPKIIRMFKDTVKIKGTCVFYFRFVRLYGASLMERYLISKGYSLPDTEHPEKGKHYVLFTGNISPHVRDKYKVMFNDPKNRFGEYIKYLILSPSGSVGVTLKNVRYLGIGTVEFNYSAIRQIMGRVNRLNSHVDLPLADRRLDNYIYIMTKNAGYYEKHKDDVLDGDKTLAELLSRRAPNHEEEAPSIERIILQDSLFDDQINEEFRSVMRSVSVI